MRGLYCVLIAVLFHSFSYSQKENSFTGQWELVSWSVGLEMDLDKDGTSSKNLMLETTCANNEVLTLAENGTLKSNKTFNPTVNISKYNSNYKISEKCNKGSIGFSNSFTIEGSDVKLHTGGKYSLLNENLIRVFEGAINVFTPDYSEVIERRDLVLTYKKR